MSNAEPLMRLIRVLEDELRTPPTQRMSGATDEGLLSAIQDARQAVLEVVHDVADDVRTAMAQAPASSRRLWSQVTFDGRRTVDLSKDRHAVARPEPTGGAAARHDQRRGA